LGAPPSNLSEQFILVGRELLPRLALHPGHSGRRQPVLRTEFNHADDRASLVKGGVGLVQIAPVLHGAGSTAGFGHCSDGASILAATASPIESTGPGTFRNKTCTFPSRPWR